MTDLLAARHVNEKMHAIFLEYNTLLTSQLETQTQYYDSLVVRRLLHWSAGVFCRRLSALLTTNLGR